MIDWSVTCPKCQAKVDSHDSHADSRAMLRSHLENMHPEVELQKLVVKKAKK